jgi:hypothetical protein
MRRALPALALSIALLAPAAARANAEAPVTLHPPEVSSALFVAGDVNRLSKVPSGSEDVVLEKALQQLYADEPALAPASAEEYIHDMQAALAAPASPSQASLELMAGNQRVVAILAALERPYGSPATALPAAARLAVTHLAAVALAGSSNIFAGAETPKYFEPLTDERTNLLYTTFAPATVLRATRTLAASNSAFGEARDALWKADSEESVFSQWSELLHESKALGAQAMRELREAVEAGNGTLTEEPAWLTARFTGGQKATQEQSCAHGGAGEEEIGGQSITGVPRLKCSGGALYEDTQVLRKKCSPVSACEAEREEVESNAAKRARAIAEERAAMIAAAELLRPSDNRAAALQQATAQAQTQITEEETAWATYEAEKAQKEAIAGGIKSGLQAGGAGLALATGNYSEGISGLIGVGFELYENAENGLSKPPPGPQEITLQDLADLSTQLAGFQQYTQEAFHALNTQLAQLTAQMARENYELKEELSSLGERLEKEQTTIFALQDQVRELFSAQTKANLQSTIEDSVGWLARTGEPLVAAKFQEALVALKKFATEIANSALVNSSETQPYTFEGADRQLTSKTSGEPSQLSEDITWLTHFPAEQGWTATPAPATLANTTFWAESSRAYAQLMLENASHTSTPDVAALRELEKEGLKLEKTQAAWSEHSGAPGSRTGNAILDDALASFEGAAYGTGVDGTRSIRTVLEEAAEASLDKWLEKNVNPGSENPTGVNLWGGAEQPFSAGSVAAAKYAALKWKECAGSEGTNGTQEMPARFIESLPRALVNGVRLGVIGAPSSGDPLILEACRTITNFAESKAKATYKTVSDREYCPGFSTSACEVIGEVTAKSETNEETVTETLTLSEGSNNYALTPPASCAQNALYWRASGESYGVDGQTKDSKNGFYDTTMEGAITKRHVGTIDLTGLHIEPKLSGVTEEVLFLPQYTENASEVFAGYKGEYFETPPCPYEGAEAKAGVEYTTYGPSESPLGSGSPFQQATMVEQVNTRLRELQVQAYGEGLHALTNPAKGNPMESLAGARALVQSYIKLGLPQALASDTALDGDIEGLGAQFLDPEPGPPRPLPAELSALIRGWSARLNKASGAALTQILGEDLIGEVQQRSSDWAKNVEEQVKPYVEGKVPGFGAGTEAVDEQSALVESTMSRLQLTRDVLSESRAPSAETLTPVGVGVSEATVRGEVDPNGGVVESCQFEYGASNYYGHTVPCSSVPGSTEKAKVVSATIASWTPEGSFHERIVVKTWGGTTYGDDIRVQLAQSADAPSGLVLASTQSTGATIGSFSAESLPPGVPLPAGVQQTVGLLRFTVNVAPGGSAQVKIELPPGSTSPTALFKLVQAAGGGEEYREIPSTLYTIAAGTIELTLVDGGPDDEDGVANGVIVDPLLPAIVTHKSDAPASASGAAASSPGAPSGPPHGSPPRVCSSRRAVTVHVASHLALAPGVRIVRTKILLRGRVIARLKGPAETATLVFAGAPEGIYRVMLVATLSNGKTRRRAIVLRTCMAHPGRRAHRRHKRAAARRAHR